jgi:hypothetical protein
MVGATATPVLVSPFRHPVASAHGVSCPLQQVVCSGSFLFFLVSIPLETLMEFLERRSIHIKDVVFVKLRR